MELRWRWANLWQRLALEPPDPVGEALWAAYSEPQRAYHTLDHLAFCFAHYDRVAAQTAQPAAVELAIWFHDAIYDPRRQDNEERSADWALRSLTAAGATVLLGQQVQELILWTKHTATPPAGDAALLVDIDLAILGQLPAVFDQYDQRIRQEYGWVPETDYRRGRAGVLRGFLLRERIYQTAPFFRWYEAQARRNLTTAISRLADT
jgi:predicted metal-dependent HD superfamily phosphohydrolase